MKSSVGTSNGVHSVNKTFNKAKFISHRNKNILKYSIPPGKLDSTDYFSRFEILFDDLKDFDFFGSDEDKFFLKGKFREMAVSSIFNFNANRSKLLNIPREELYALLKLSKNKDSVITKPDKGSGIVILNRIDYVNKMLSILSGETKFKLAGNQDIYKFSQTI